MKLTATFFYEWKHFIRNPFKIIALLLFLIASIYGLHKGAALYHKQSVEIDQIKEKIEEDRQKVIGYFEENQLVPEERPWIDYGTPFWSIWFSYVHYFKEPSPAMVYSTGQSEQFGYYKRITFWANPYDADLVEEIANPERLQIGTLDYSFAILFLLPLVLLILLYNLRSLETEQGFMSIIDIQAKSNISWIIQRMSFYILLLVLLIAALTFYGRLLTDAPSSSFSPVLFLSLSYLLFWSLIFFVIILKGKTILGNTLKMIGVFLLFSFIIPGAVHQYVSIKMPANLMTDLIDVRDEQQELYNQADSVYRAKLFALFPEIVNSPLYQDSSRIQKAVNESASALSNELKKASVIDIENENQKRAEIVKRTYWFNPTTFFQNQFNHLSNTHFDDYQAYRDGIQLRIDRQIELLIEEVWKDEEVDQEKYNEYYLRLINLEDYE